MSSQLKGREIVVIASAPWNISGKVNCHHLAERLAEENRVLFVESPGLRTPNLSSTLDINKVFRRGISWMKSVGRDPVRIHDQLHVLSPLSLPMYGRRLVEEVNRRVYGGAVRNAVARLGMTDPILWIFLPTGAHVMDALPNASVIYHRIDHFSEIDGVNDRAVQSMEQRLLDRASIVFATSQPLAEGIETESDEVHCIPNVADVEHFMTPRPTPDELSELSAPVVGYVGYLSSAMIDFSLLERLVETRPDLSFVFIGTAGDAKARDHLVALDQWNHVHYLGPRPFASVPAMMQCFDIGIIPFIRSLLTDSALPLKTFEYLAAGAPVLSTPLPAMRAEPLDEVVFYADDAIGFSEQIDRILETSTSENRKKRRNIAQRYSWRVRYAQISEIVNRAIPGVKTLKIETTRNQTHRKKRAQRAG